MGIFHSYDCHNWTKILNRIIEKRISKYNNVWENREMISEMENYWEIYCQKTFVDFTTFIFIFFFLYIHYFHVDQFLGEYCNFTYFKEQGNGSLFHLDKNHSELKYLNGIIIKSSSFVYQVIALKQNSRW